MQPRAIRPAPEPLAGYLRPGRNDHKVLRQVLSEHSPACFKGIVCEATHTDRHLELWEDCHRKGMEAVLDTLSMEIATEGGFRSNGGRMPWSDVFRRPADFDSSELRGYPQLIAKFIKEFPLTAVLAPAHYIESPADPWLAVDSALTVGLRDALDARGLEMVPIYYPLGTSTRILRNHRAWQCLVEHLRRLPVDAVWIRISPFGASTDSGATVRAVIEACADLHCLHVPLVAERTGTLGLALAAFGAVGGVEGGITLREHFDFNRIRKPREGPSGFSHPPRVYIPELATFLDAAPASLLLENRTMRSRLACRGHWCCERGAKDMLQDPRRHFVARRTAEMWRMSRVPERARAQVYLEEILRPATDLLARAARVVPALETPKRRLENWRFTLGSMLSESPSKSFAMIPRGRRVPVSIGA